MELPIVYRLSSLSYATLGTMLVFTSFGSYYTGLWPEVRVFAALLCINSITSYTVDVVRFDETCGLPAMETPLRHSTTVWLRLDRGAAVLTALSCAANSIWIPLEASLFFVGAGCGFMACFLAGRGAARQGELTKHLVYHSCWHILPVLTYAAYIWCR